jgi:hypothetical protein
MYCNCSVCGAEIEKGDSHDHKGKVLCEDCLMDAMGSIKTCDPWAVHAATKDRKNRKLTNSEGLTHIQKKIYEYIKLKGKALPDEAAKALGVDRLELERQFTILRHCELLKGKKEDNKVFITLF